MTKLTWTAEVIYEPGEVVLHQGKMYAKLDDGDNTAPDAVAGGWQEVRDVQAEGLAEYQAIEASFSTYEERVKLHQAELALKRQQTIEKIKALGATDEDIAALVV